MRIRLYTVQDASGGLISVMARPRGGDWLADEVEALREAEVTTVVSLLTPDEVSEFELDAEEQERQKRGIAFLAFPIRDRSVPALTTETRSFLEQLETRHLAQEHLVIHCRQGLGRAVLIAANACSC